MSKEIHICTQMEWPNPAESLKAAIEENPSNILQNFSHPGISMALASTHAPYLALLFQRKWMQGRTLNIAFLGTTEPAVKEKIKVFANRWLDYINLKFNFVEGIEGDIRIATKSGGSWSQVGTDAKLVPAGEPTMNYGWLDLNTSDKEYSRVVLHEFGHALGAIHEHQHPDVGIPWDKPKVYEYYAKQGWSKEMVDNHIFAKYSHDQLNASTYDQFSIMHYAVPNELTIGDWEVGWNTELSELDKKFMRKQYT